MAKYHRVKQEDGKAYFVDHDGNRLNDKDTIYLARQILETIKQPAYLYVGEDWYGENEGLYKIGYSINPERRARELDIEMKMCMAAYSYGDQSAKHYESLVHRLFKAVGLHVHGEWFNIEKSDVEALKALLCSDDSTMFMIGSSLIMADKLRDLTEIVDMVERFVLDGPHPIEVLDRLVEVGKELLPHKVLLLSYVFRYLANDFHNRAIDDNQRAITLSAQYLRSALDWYEEHTTYRNIVRDKWDFKTATA